MPFCTECGARHDETATVCPSCGAPIDHPPEDLDDLLDSMAELSAAAAPPAGQPADESGSGAYLREMQAVRGAIASQSSALQGLSDLSWSNPEANAIREQLASALERLQELRPPPALDSAHQDFLEGADLLARGFGELVDATERPGTRIDRSSAEQAIADATARFVRGAGAINEYMTSQGYAEADEPLADDEITLDEIDRAAAAGPAEPAPFELDELDLPPVEEVPPAPSRPAASTPRPEGTRPPAALAPAEELDRESRGGLGEAWTPVGEPGTDSLLLEIEGGWVRSRAGVHEAIERSVRAAVTDALRGAMATRVRVEQEARATVTRIAGERARLLDEVESLRREAHQLQSELAELRRTINELERERQLSQERRQQMFQDAEAQRNQLLKEIESLGGQLEAMRRNIVNLLNMSAEASALTGAPAAELPAAVASAGLTEVRIKGVANAIKNLQLQRTIRGVAGVAVEGQPGLKDGVLTLSLRHDPSLDLRGALEGAGLRFQGTPAADVLEFAAA
ncbi:MAG TPA: zinc-ribbon domain-containing protein [Chloroflexota bacterium]